MKDTVMRAEQSIAVEWRHAFIYCVLCRVPCM